MPSLNIPPELQPGLAKLANLPDDVATALFSAIQRVATVTHNPWVEQVGQIPGLPPTHQNEILEALNSLYQVRASADVPVAEFASDVCDAMEHRVRKDLAVPLAKIPAFQERLTKFLAIDVLNRAAKATVLRHDHEHPLCSARILTDARPVFGQDATEGPEGMVISHMLRIAYHEGRNIKEIYIALDNEDLDEMASIVDRARKKAASLKKALTAAKITVIDE